MTLTEEQEYVVSAIIKDITVSKKKVIKLAGLAGTGKSLLVKYLAEHFSNYAICAYTGKAANVLRKRGIASASTIHQNIYRYFEDEKTGEPRFALKKYVDCDGFIVDEASMVGSDIYSDLLKFNKPIIFVGDHGQLEPIKSNNFIHLMKTPDYTLEKIHRNAGEIARFAEWIRLGKDAKKFIPENDKVRILNPRDISQKDIVKSSQIIGAYNNTRIRINRLVRRLLGLSEDENNDIENSVFVKKEKVICLRNNHRLQLFNGMQGIVKDVYKNRIVFSCPDVMDGAMDVQYVPEVIGKKNINPNDYDYNSNLFDYGYCVTCHKAQGDQWEDVVVYHEKNNKWDDCRWAYTASSRASNSLIWLTK